MFKTEKAEEIKRKLTQVFSEEQSETILSRINSVFDEMVKELAEAQKRTEKKLGELVWEHKRTREMLAGLPDTVGYSLEDIAMLYMPYFCKKEFGIDVKLIDRRNIVYPGGRFDEINIYNEGQKNCGKVYVIGECKARPGEKEIHSLLKAVERLKNFFKAEVYPFIIGYYYSPDVKEYLKKEKPEIKALNKR